LPQRGLPVGERPKSKGCWQSQVPKRPNVECCNCPHALLLSLNTK
jgi:hypothetical protein